MATYYLVDFENVNDTGLRGIDELSYEDCVFIFYTAYANRVGLDMLEGIQAGLRVIKTPTGDQSLDRHLISYLGYLLGQESNPETRYQIISQDNGYRSIVTFWNSWFDVEGKVKQRPCIGCQSGITAAAPYIMSDGSVLTEQGIELRRTIIRYFHYRGEKSLNGYSKMSVPDLCSYLSGMPCYDDEKKRSGKKPMAFLMENLKDILTIRREQSTDVVYLIRDDEYWEMLDPMPYQESHEPLDDAPDTDMQPDIVPETEEASIEETMTVPEEAETQEIANEVPEEVSEDDLLKPMQSVILQSFETDAEKDASRKRRVRASLLRDRLDKIEKYRREQSHSGQKPLDYLAKAMEGLAVIRIEKGRSWAYLVADVQPEPDPQKDGQESQELTPTLDGAVTSEASAVPAIAVENMSPMERTIFERLSATGKDPETAAAIAAAAFAATLLEQPKAEFHSRLWQLFGQKLGTRYYRETMEVGEECFV